MRPRTSLPILFLALLATTLPAFAIEHAVAGKITRIDSTAKTMVVRLADGTEPMGKSASVDISQGIVKGSKYDAQKGEKVVVHYTDEAGNKVAHFIKHL